MQLMRPPRIVLHYTEHETAPTARGLPCPPVFSGLPCLILQQAGETGLQALCHALEHITKRDCALGPCQDSTRLAHCS